MYERFSKRLQGRHDEGFTLIELLIVIVILGILAAIVVFAIGKTRGDSVASACKTNFKSIELSAEAVNTKVGKYPITGGTAAAPTPLTDDAVGTTGATSGKATNPVVSSAVKSDGTPLANGALLKSYPTSSDYKLAYSSFDGSSYQIQVQTSAGAPVATNPTTSAGCDAL
jgi:general secretion pathway protein G